jgi:hypothetical protein
MVALASTACSNNVLVLSQERRKREKEEEVAGWLAGPKRWAARAFGLGCNTREITG